MARAASAGPEHLLGPRRSPPPSTMRAVQSAAPPAAQPVAGRKRRDAASPARPISQARVIPGALIAGMQELIPASLASAAACRSRPARQSCCLLALVGGATSSSLPSSPDAPPPPRPESAAAGHEAARAAESLSPSRIAVTAGPVRCSARAAQSLDSSAPMSRSRRCSSSATACEKETVSPRPGHKRFASDWWGESTMAVVCTPGLSPRHTKATPLLCRGRGGRHRRRAQRQVSA